MPPDPLESLRFETAEWLSKRPDLAYLQQQLEAALDLAETERDQLDAERAQFRSDWREWLINAGGSGLAATGLLKMMTAATLSFGDLAIGGLGSLLTLWGGNRFRGKVEAESSLARRVAALMERVQHLEQALSTVGEARQLQQATSR